MSGAPSDRCGHTWPDDHEVDDDPTHQNCCWRETVGGEQRCVWHINSDAVSKSIEELQGARAPPEIRAQNSGVDELLDGAELSSLNLRDAISFENVAVRDSNFSDSVLSGAEFSDASLGGADLSGASLGGSNLYGANLTCADLSDAVLRESNLSDVYLNGANLSGADLARADLSNGFLKDTDLSEANLEFANLTGTSLRKANLSNAEMLEANLTEADLFQADLTNVLLFRADLTDANLNGVDLTNANLGDTDLTDTGLGGADLTDVSLADAVLIRTNLHSANLTDTMIYGTTLTDVQINAKTMIRGKEYRLAERRWWQRGPLFPLQRCAYDPEVSEKVNHLGRAADTYQTFEMLARDNARPSLQSEMFVLRQDMQRKRHWQNGEYFDWAFAWVSRAVFKYGESLGRIVTFAVLLITAYAAIYAYFDLIRDATGQFVGNPVDALYFSTLTFTTLGLGDFQPEATSQVARLLVTSQAALGAILIAIFVFVLGRRAAR